MSGDLQEIERLIKQSAELSGALIRLARKLQQQDNKLDQEQEDGLGALHAKLADLRSYIDVMKREIDPPHYYIEAHAKTRQGVAEQTGTPQEAALDVLRDAVADKTMTPEQAAEQLVKLLRADLLAPRKIEIRQTAKASLEAGDDIAGKIRPFLKNAHDQAEQPRHVNKP